MSTFLGFSSALVPSGATATSMQALFSSVLASYGWQIVRQAVVPTAILGTFATPGQAMDNTSTTSATTTSLPVYVGVNIATGFTPTVMHLQADWANPQWAPLTFTLDYSSNGSSWTTLQTFTNNINWTSCERRRFTINSATNQAYWRINVTATNSGTNCYIGEWILEDANGNWLSNTNFFDCIPPTTEVIGNSYTRDFLRLGFTTTAITMRALQELFTTIPEICIWYSPVAGATTSSITLNSNTVSYTGIASNTAAQNARGLYEACRASVNANFTAWTWVWTGSLAATSGSTGYIFAVAKTPAMNILPTSVNMITQIRGTSVYNVPIVQGSQMPYTSSITTDCVNGWIYYLQICSRGIALASKTNSSYYTPVHACYGDNTSVVSQIPTADLAQYGIPCTPIELVVGTDNAVGTCDASAWSSHAWGVLWQIANNGGSPGLVDGNSSTTQSVSNFAHHTFAGHLQDVGVQCIAPNWGTWGAAAFTMAAEGFFEGSDTGMNWTIHKLACRPADNNNYASAYCNGTTNTQFRNTGPFLPNLDWYKFTGTAPSNEQLIIAPCNDFTTTISTTGLTTDIVINVVSTTGFPSSGWLVLEGEIIQYTGITATQFTGCTRGKYNSQIVSPLVGTTINIGAWYVFMVQGLLFGGYQVPA